jgi:hypothetical protein
VLAVASQAQRFISIDYEWHGLKRKMTETTAPFPRMRESRRGKNHWIPACAGMTLVFGFGFGFWLI